MDTESTHWTSVVAALAWVAFFVTLIFRPRLAWDYPVLAVLAIGGAVVWAIRARRTRRQEKARLLESDGQ